MKNPNALWIPSSSITGASIATGEDAERVFIDMTVIALRRCRQRGDRLCNTGATAAFARLFAVFARRSARLPLSSPFGIL